MPLTQLYPILVEKNLISPVIPRPYNSPLMRDFDQKLTCDFHYGEVGHAVENCRQLRHRVQDLIYHGVLKFEGLPNITTNPLPNHSEGNVNVIEAEDLDISTIDEEEEVLTEHTKSPPAKDLDISIANTEGGMHAEQIDPLPIEDLSINVTTTEEDSTSPPIHHYQPGEDARTWTSTPLLQCISSSNE